MLLRFIKKEKQFSGIFDLLPKLEYPYVKRVVCALCAEAPQLQQDKLFEQAKHLYDLGYYDLALMLCNTYELIPPRPISYLNKPVSLDIKKNWEKIKQERLDWIVSVLLKVGNEETLCWLANHCWKPVDFDLINIPAIASDVSPTK